VEDLVGYRLDDLLPFSRETYLRLFELYHGDLWPAQILAGALGVAMIFSVLGGRLAQIRATLTILAVVWLWIAYGFQAERYMTINWAAEGFAWAFAGQAALLLLAAIWPGHLRAGPSWVRGAGATTFALGLVVLPLAGLALDRDWREVEFFALTPDASALATLGVLVAVAGIWRWLLALIPLAWSIVSGGTALAMDSPEAFVLWLAGSAALLLMLAGAFSPSERAAA
jgi:hypothetical protein